VSAVSAENQVDKLRPGLEIACARQTHPYPVAADSMAIPDFQTLMLPVLQFAADGRVHTLAEARDAIAAKFGLTAADRAELLPSGRARRFDNRVAWAKSYLHQAELLSSERRGHFAVTERGRSVLTESPERIDIGFLERFEEFRQFRAIRRPSGDVDTGGSAELPPQTQTPEEALEQAHAALRKELAAELLQRVRAGSPRFFESLVIDLLLQMGYGGNRAEAGRAIGGSGDEGVDGIISEDRLGLDNIYIQAKRWQGSVGRPELQKFVGALQGKRARKGVFLTTGTFSVDAIDYVAHIDPRVVLIDGKQLAEHMIDFNVGVGTRARFEVKSIDSDYFSDE
jgi:restriction system protein